MTKIKIKKIFSAVSLFFICLVFFNLISAGPAVVEAQTPPTNQINTATTPTPNPQGAYVGKGVEASIKALLCTPSSVDSATTTGTTSTPGVNSTATVSNNPAAQDLSNCINKGYRFAIAFGAVAAVFFMVLAGYMYMVGGEHGKQEAKSVIVSVLVGFLIMLSSYVLLRQINPTLVAFRSIQPPALLGNYGPLSCANVKLGENCVAADGTPSTGDGNGGGNPIPGPGGTAPAGMTDAKSVIPDLLLDMRYATANNFMGKKLYTDANCYLKTAVVNKLKAAQAAAKAKKSSYSIKVFDCYRPVSVQQQMVDWAIANNHRDYIGKYIGAVGSGQHPKGEAIDLTLTDGGSNLDMPSDFDVFNTTANYPTTFNTAENKNAKILHDIMVSGGLKAYSGEWWHFHDP